MTKHQTSRGAVCREIGTHGSEREGSRSDSLLDPNQLRLFVGYKANIAGVPVVFVPPAYTSQTCSRCHHLHPDKGKSYRFGKSFKCGHCGFEYDADVNAALNIAVLGYSVIVPESPGISCQLERQLSLFPTNYFELG